MIEMVFLSFSDFTLPGGLFIQYVVYRVTCCIITKIYISTAFYIAYEVVSVVNVPITAVNRLTGSQFDCTVAICKNVHPFYDFAFDRYNRYQSFQLHCLLTCRRYSDTLSFATWRVSDTLFPGAPTDSSSGHHETTCNISSFSKWADSPIFIYFKFLENTLFGSRHFCSLSNRQCKQLRSLVLFQGWYFRVNSSFTELCTQSCHSLFVIFWGCLCGCSDTSLVLFDSRMRPPLCTRWFADRTIFQNIHYISARGMQFLTPIHIFSLSLWSFGLLFLALVEIWARLMVLPNCDLTVGPRKRWFNCINIISFAATTTGSSFSFSWDSSRKMKWSADESQLYCTTELHPKWHLEILKHNKKLMTKNNRHKISKTQNNNQFTQEPVGRQPHIELCWR